MQPDGTEPKPANRSRRRSRKTDRFPFGIPQVWNTLYIYIISYYLNTIYLCACIFYILILYVNTVRVCCIGVQKGRRDPKAHTTQPTHPTTVLQKVLSYWVH